MAHSNLKIILWQQQIETLEDGYHSLLLGRTKAAIVLAVQHISPEPKGFCIHVTFTGIDSPLIAEWGSWIKYLLSQVCATEFLSLFLTQLWLVWLHVCLSAISASRHYPARLGVKFLSYRFKGDFPNFRAQCSILSCLTQVFQLSLTSQQTSVCQRHVHQSSHTYSAEWIRGRWASEVLMHTLRLHVKLWFALKWQYVLGKCDPSNAKRLDFPNSSLICYHTPLDIPARYSDVRQRPGSEAFLGL